MKKARITESPIVAILKEGDADMKVADICRKHGISDVTYYNSNAKYDGREASDLKRINPKGSDLFVLTER